MAKKASHHLPLATAYAHAVLDLATAGQQAEAVGQELGGLREVVESDPAFGAFLSDPAVGRDRRQAVLERALGGQVSPLVMRVLGLLVHKGHAGLLPEIAVEYDRLLDRQLGKVDVDVTVARELDGGQLEQVRQRISAALEKTAIVRQKVDDAIIGGLMLQVEDRLIDASVRSQLLALRERMRMTRVR